MFSERKKLCTGRVGNLFYETIYAYAMVRNDGIAVVIRLMSISSLCS